MTLVTKADAFSRADGPLNVSGGNWVGRSTSNPALVSGRCVAAATGGTGYAVHVDSQEGAQTSKVTLKVLGSATHKASVYACVEDVPDAPGSNSINIYASTAPSFYRFRADSTQFRLQAKTVGTSGSTTLDTYDVAPAVDDTIEIRYDPATNIVEGYVNDVLRCSSDQSSDPLPDTQTRIGFHLESSTEISRWDGSWEVDDGGGDPGSGGWAYYEWDGVSVETPLTLEGEFNGTTVDALDLASTAEYPTETSSLTLRQPRWSDTVRDGLGVNCHYKFSGSSTNVHKEVAQLTAYLTELGCGWIRDRMTNPGSVHNTQMQQFGILQAAHIGVHLTLSQGTNPGWDGTTQSDVNYYWSEISAHPTWRWSVGGPNEPDDVPQISGWPTKLRNHMKWIYDGRAAAGMPQVPIASPSLKDGQSVIEQSFLTMGATDAWQWCDVNDIHRYPLGKNSPDPEWTSYQPNALGRTPAFLLDLRLQWSRACWKGSVDYSTEGGYNTDLNVTAGGEHIPDDIHGYYAERHLCEMLYRGVKRFFYYELMDDPDPGDNLSEAHRGLIFTPTLTVSTWSRKPAFNRLKALMALVKDYNTTYDVDTNPFVPPKVRMDITCNDSQFRYLFLAKRNGTKILLYWLDKALWDVGSNTRIGTSSGEVTQQLLGNWPSGNLPGGVPMDEISGMVHSRIHSNVVWAHDDSNPGHFVYAFDYTGGISHKKTIELVGSGFTITEDGQWEDAAYSTPDGSIWIANCGGNLNEITAYKFVEPSSISGSSTVTQVSCERFKFQYSGGQSFNCETMLCDPSGRVYFVPKHNGVGDGQTGSEVGLWQAPASLAAWPTANTLTKVATIPPQGGGVYGGGDWAPDNSFFIPIKTANQIPETQPTVPTKRWATSSPYAEIDQFPLAVARKANRANPITMEAAAFKPDSSGILVSSEGTGSELWLTDFGTGTSGGVPATLELDDGPVQLTATPIVQSYTWT